MTIPGFAQMGDVEIKADRKKLDEQKQRSGGNQTVTTKEIAYKITITNRSFKPIPELQIKYMIFVEAATAGDNSNAVGSSNRGSETVSSLAANSTVEVDTKPFQLTTTDLDPGWSYVSGAGNRARDKAGGIWIRAYSGGKLVAEYSNPSSISKKNDWKE